MRGKTLVTGAGGFIGSHLAEHLARRGHSVRAFVHYNALGSWGWLDHSDLRADMEVVAGDIRDFDSVSAAMSEVTQVFHLAALIGIPYSYRSPLAYVKTNVEGTYNVLEAARARGARVMATSTSEVYGTARTVPIAESHPLQPQSPYSASKIGADQLALSYHHAFGQPVTLARPFNTYGPRQSARAIIPSIATQLIANPKASLKLGNLEPKRDLVYVGDTVRAMEAIAGCDALVGQAVNIGTGKEISIRELAQAIARKLGTEARFETESERVRPDSSEVFRLLCDARLLESKTGWKPEHDLESGLEVAIGWLRENTSRYRAGYHV